MYIDIKALWYLLVLIIMFLAAGKKNTFLAVRRGFLQSQFERIDRTSTLGFIPTEIFTQFPLYDYTVE